MHPDARIVDIAHEVPAQDISAGAYILSQAAPYFPENTIHLAVVDPGVGSERVGIILRAGQHWYVGPDNGLFDLVAPKPNEAYQIKDEPFRIPTPSSTFHGRDIFAVTAAQLALGTPAHQAGPRRSRHPSSTVYAAQVVHIDRYGNIITNLRGADLAPGKSFCVGDKLIAEIRSTYAAVEIGQPVAYVGSAGTLEFAIRNGNAAQEFSVTRGMPVFEVTTEVNLRPHA